MYGELTKEFLEQEYINKPEISQNRLAKFVRETFYPLRTKLQIRSAIVRRVKKFGLHKIEIIRNIKREIIEITPEMEQIILGSLLGDMSIYANDYTAYITESHGQKQTEYIQWKCTKLANIGTKCGLINATYNGKPYPHYSIHSKALLQLNDYYTLFDNYENDKKKIREVLSKINELGLAIWYLDDGHYAYRNRTLGLAIIRLSEGCADEVISWFKDRWNITPKKINIKRKDEKIGIILRFDVEETKLFLNIVSPYIPECMEYKKGLDENRIKESKFKVKKYRDNFYKTDKHKIYHRNYYREYWRKRHPNYCQEKSCKYCGILFKPKYSNHQLYCSNKCKWTVANRNTRLKKLK